MQARLLAITPPAAVQDMIDPAIVEAWIEGGAAEIGLVVLLREPQADLAVTLARFTELRAALRDHGIPTLVSVDPDRHTELGPTALAGVQLRGDPREAQLQRWRAALGPEAIIGRSCHGLPTPASSSSICDYTCVAPVFAPRTPHPGVDKPAIGLAAVEAWAAVTPRVFGLGGVDLARAEACLAAGASGIAGISLFFGRCEDARENVRALRQVFARVEAGTRPDEHGPQA